MVNYLFGHCRSLCKDSQNGESTVISIHLVWMKLFIRYANKSADKRTTRREVTSAASAVDICMSSQAPSEKARSTEVQANWKSIAVAMAANRNNATEKKRILRNFINGGKPRLKMNGSRYRKPNRRKLESNSIFRWQLKIRLK